MGQTQLNEQDLILDVANKILLLQIVLQVKITGRLSKSHFLCAGRFIWLETFAHKIVPKVQ